MDKLIIQLGRVYIRIGWTSHLQPLTFPAPSLQSLTLRLLPALLAYLAERIAQSCILLVPIYFPKDVVEEVCRILFRNLGVNEIQFLAAESMPLCLTGCKSGVVIHSGFSQTVFMPIFEGFPVKIGITCANVGIRQILVDAVKEIDPRGSPDEKWLIESSERIEQKKEITWEGKVIETKYLLRMFGNWNAQEQNLVDSFCSLISKIPPSCVSKVINCLVFSGPVWKWQHTKSTFVKGLLAKIKDQALPLVQSSTNVNIAKRIVREELMCFAGASLIGTKLNAKGLRLGAKEQQIVDLVGRWFIGM